MPTPSKPFQVIKSEGKSHRTKAELKQRQQGEEALSTGVTLKEHPEVRNNTVAHKEFRRINSLLKSIEKNDAIYEGVINRYCLLLAECADFEDQKEKIPLEINEIREMYQNEEISSGRYLDEKNNLHARALYCDKKIMEKRKMMFDIEKENIMTIAAALRSIPKKEEKANNKLLEALK
jgi:hypothetical protein